jgi:hypothetical protein
MRLVARSLAVVVLAALATPSFAAPPGFAFLNVPAGARGAALAGAYVSVVSGPEAAFWDPAGLASVDGLQASATHIEFLSHLRHEQFVLAGPAFGGGLAASVRAMYSEAITARDELGNETGSFGSHDLEFRLAYGRRAAPGLTLGGSAQLVRERLDNESAMTYAFGCGGAFEPARWPGLRLALAADQLGPSARFSIGDGEGQPVALPASAQGGLSYLHAVGSGLTLRGALESRVTVGRTGVGMLGAELAHPASGVALRAGARLNDHESAMAFGAGCALGTLQVDYAFVPFKDDLGDTHRFSLGARF